MRSEVSRGDGVTARDGVRTSLNIASSATARGADVQ